MKFASMIVAYNEEHLIRGCLHGLKDLFNIVGISTPWQGKHEKFDKTEEYAKEMGARIFREDFKTEHEQRTTISKLAKLLGYDYIFIIDADEFYLREDIQKAMNFIEKNPDRAYTTTTEVNFWKDEKWEVTPKAIKIRLVCVPAGTEFTRNRNTKYQQKEYLALPSDIILYHFCYTGSDEHILSKLSHFSHAAEMKTDWFENVWKKWTPDMENIHPAISNPWAFKSAIPVECPEEIKKRYYEEF